MSDPKAKLQEKAIAVTQQLQQWAKREKILRPGEQIIFTLSIRSIPTVSQELDDILDMKPVDFFTKKRLSDADVPIQGYFVRISDLVLNCDHAYVREKGHEPSVRYINLPTMRHLVAAPDEIGRAPNVGNRTIAAIAKILAFNGIITRDW